MLMIELGQSCRLRGSQLSIAALVRAGAELIALYEDMDYDVLIMFDWLLALIDMPT